MIMMLTISNMITVQMKKINVGIILKTQSIMNTVQSQVVEISNQNCTSTTNQLKKTLYKINVPL